MGFVKRPLQSWIAALDRSKLQQNTTRNQSSEAMQYRQDICRTRCVILVKFCVVEGFLCPFSEAKFQYYGYINVGTSS